MVVGREWDARFRGKNEVVAAYSRFEASPRSASGRWTTVKDDTSERFEPGLHEVDGTYFVFELSQPYRYRTG